MGKQNIKKKKNDKGKERKISGRRARRFTEYINEPDDDSDNDSQSGSVLYSNKNDGKTTNS